MGCLNALKELLENVGTEYMHWYGVACGKQRSPEEETGGS